MPETEIRRSVGLRRGRVDTSPFARPGLPAPDRVCAFSLLAAEAFSHAVHVAVALLGDLFAVSPHLLNHGIRVHTFHLVRRLEHEFLG